MNYNNYVWKKDFKESTRISTPILTCGLKDGTNLDIGWLVLEERFLEKSLDQQK